MKCGGTGAAFCEMVNSLRIRIGIGVCGLAPVWSAFFMAGAGNRVVARCGGGHISRQAQYFVHVTGVGVQIFLAGAGNPEVASCGGGECFGIDV